MSKKTIFALSSLALLVLILSACNLANRQAQGPQPTAVSMANPASVFCEQQGGKVEMQRDAQGGQFGACVFPDGSRCEEWAFMRGECTPGAQPSPAPTRPPANDRPPATPETPLIGMANPASVYCEWMGGALEIRNDNDDKGGQTGMCVFKDGSQCEEWAFFRSECQPAAPQEHKQVLGMPNPASVACEQRGGHIELRSDEKGGPLGMCIFDDGSQCEEWALFRGECHAPGGPQAPGLANPASLFCEQNGGRLEIRSGADGGQAGVCIFPDNSECDEWAFLRGECRPGGQATASPIANIANPASLFCEQQGGVLEIRTDSQGGQYGLCAFADGSQCEEWALFNGQCRPGGKSETVGEYINTHYGYTLKLPEGWSVEETNAQQVILRNEFYELFLGVQHPGEEPQTFRSDTPTGEHLDGGTFTLLGQPQPKQLLVVDGMTRRVEYASRLEAGPLLLTAWLEYRGAADYARVDLPAAIIAQAEAILASFALK